MPRHERAGPSGAPARDRSAGPRRSGAGRDGRGHDVRQHASFRRRVGDRTTSHDVRRCPDDVAHPRTRARSPQALTDAGPDAPTLCEGWQRAAPRRARRAARERRRRRPRARRSRASPGAPSSAIEDLARRPASPRAGYRDLVARVADVAPALAPDARGRATRANLVEFFVHTEDVRRGAGAATRRASSSPSARTPCGRSCVRAARLCYRRVAVGRRPRAARRRAAPSSRRPARGHGDGRGARRGRRAAAARVRSRCRGAASRRGRAGRRRGA